MLHLVLVPIPGDDGGMLPEELQKQCELKKIKGIYLMPSYAQSHYHLPLARTQNGAGGGHRKKASDPFGG